MYSHYMTMQLGFFLDEMLVVAGVLLCEALLGLAGMLGLTTAEVACVE